MLKTGRISIATVMRRLLTGHAGYFNKRHCRTGHLFQNRYKSILSQEDTYLLELIRYIHLNPLRAGLIKDIDLLRKYPYSGHSTLISMGRRRELTGGGLIRSMGGWQIVKSMRKAKVFEKSDERILGDGDFVDQVLSVAEEQIERRNLLISRGYDLKMIAERVCSLMDLDPSEIWKMGKARNRVAARSLLCFWAVRGPGISMTVLSRKPNLSSSGVSQSVSRGEKIAEINDLRLLDMNL